MSVPFGESVMSMDSERWQAFLLQQPIPYRFDDVGSAVLRRFASEHLEIDGPHKRWFAFADLRVYLRLSRRWLPVERCGARMIDIADVEVAPGARERGVFSRFLLTVERQAGEVGLGVFVESIMNPVLRDALSRRGYLIEAKISGFEICDALLSPAQIALRTSRM